MSDDSYNVVETRDAVRDYGQISDHLAVWTGDTRAADRIVDDIRRAVKSLQYCPYRGAARDDIRDGLRVLPVLKRGVIAYDVDERNQRVIVLRIFYGGEDLDAVMQAHPGPDGTT